MEQIDELAATYSKSLRVPSDKEKFKKDAADKVHNVHKLVVIHVLQYGS